MTQTKPTNIVPCPTCKKSTVWSSDNQYRPFCCERCKLIDLGAWASEEHNIPGDPINPYANEDGEDLY